MNRVPLEEKLCQFMIQYNNDECTREVLQLLGRHPRTRLNHLAIVHAVDWRRMDIDRALKVLIDRRLVKSKTSYGQAVYYLTDEEPQRAMAIKAAALDLAQWRTVLTRKYTPPAPPAAPVYRSNLSAHDAIIMAAARHRSAFVLPQMPKFVKVKVS